MSENIMIATEQEEIRCCDDQDVTSSETIQADEEEPAENYENKNESLDTFVDYLHKKNLDEHLIRCILETGLTDEYKRILKALGFIDKELKELSKLWQIYLDGRDSTDSGSSCCFPFSSCDDRHLPPDKLYLKSTFGGPLTKALLEIIAKKPSDPVEYLGHWLLHFRICELHRKTQEKYDMELRIEREKLKTKGKDVEDEVPVIVDQEEEEGFEEDHHFRDYEGI